MTTTLIHRSREIKDGPGREDWLEANSYPWPLVYMSVRGFTSTCSCPVGGKCDECREAQKVYLRVVVSFNPDMKGDVWVYYAFVSLDEKVLLTLKPHEEGQREETVLPDGVQFVYGRYDLTRFGRKWMVPAPMSFHDTFLALNNASLVRPRVSGDCD